jgi:PAS domain S-box-containing protein
MFQPPNQGPYLRALFEQLPIAVLLANDDARYVDANAAACQLFERSRAELVGAHVGSIIAPGMEASVDAQWRAFLRDGEQSGLFTIVLPSGRARQVHFHARANFVPGLHCSLLDSVTVSADGSPRSGDLLTMCAWTKRVRIHGAWVPIEQYLAEQHGLRVSHGIAPDAFRKLFDQLEGG